MNNLTWVGEPSDIRQFTDLEELHVRHERPFFYSSDFKMSFMPPNVRSLEIYFDGYKKANNSAKEQTALANIHYLSLNITIQTRKQRRLPKAMGFRNLRGLRVH